MNPNLTEIDVLRNRRNGMACTNPRSTTFSGLTRGTRYAIEVSAVNSYGRGPFAYVG